MVERASSHGPAGWRIDATASLLAVVALSGFAALKAFELRAESDRRRAAEQRLVQLETQDPLTGLANRDRMLEFLGQALQTRKTGDEVTGLLLIDLKRFTPINDAHGRAVGDRLLRMVGERLQSVAREGEMVARLGGDEFAVVLPRLDCARAARHPAQRLVRALEAPFEIDDLALRIGGAAVGVATSANTELRPGVLVHHVDAALQRAKRQQSADSCSDRRGTGKA
ncbi:GGDEF domain-containing protein [Caulobacter sp. BK020]|uniref:GGDEF domain-containing protein n=1 Tax=Caulobacter sp. BK020 TaxID=2512117 RepID=UPI00140459C5|nr:GGDEF domain-containing protein [Caulobacter sp. BK020]